MTETIDQTAQDVEIRDHIQNFGGRQLLYVLWERHLMICAPLAFAVSPDKSLRRFIDEELAGSGFAAHPDFARIDWSAVQWRGGDGQPFTPRLDASLRDNGLVHKSLLRMITPGLDGLRGSGC